MAKARRTEETIIKECLDKIFLREYDVKHIITCLIDIRNYIDDLLVGLEQTKKDRDNRLEEKLKVHKSITPVYYNSTQSHLKKKGKY